MSVRDAFCISPVVSLPWAVALFISSCIDKASLPVTGKMRFVLLRSKMRLRHILPWLSPSLCIEGQKLGWIQGSETHWIPRPSCFPCLAFVRIVSILFLRLTVPFSPAWAWEHRFLGERHPSLSKSAAGLVCADKCLHLLWSRSSLET